MRLGHIYTPFAAASLMLASGASAQSFDPAPWLADLEQARIAVHEKYANLDWLEGEREVDVDSLFARSAKQVASSGSDRDVRLIFDRLERRIGDGHVDFVWPASPPSPVSSPATAPDLCNSLGYDERQSTAGTAQAMAGYQPLGGDNPFPAGIVASAGRKVGVIRIGVFQPQGYPQVCREAVKALKIQSDRPCDDECQDHILTQSYRRLTEALEQRVRQLQATGAGVLLVDIGSNGGGSEWAEAAVRIFSPRQLVSARTGFMRGEHWAKQWRELGDRLREFAMKASAADRKRLLAWAAEADVALREAQTQCPVTSNSCQRLGRAGYSTGLVGSVPSGAFDGKDWGVYVFSPAQYRYHDGLWRGPVVVLVDQETWSAAEEFAAVLQDNRAAVILGARTGGAGCGHTYGGTPTKLKNSGVVLELPDCVRYRADGSNEVRGIIPDELVGLRANDGAHLRARLVAEKLPAAIAKAETLAATP